VNETYTVNHHQIKSHVFVPVAGIARLHSVSHWLTVKSANNMKQNVHIIVGSVVHIFMYFTLDVSSTFNIRQRCACVNDVHCTRELSLATPPNNTHTCIIYHVAYPVRQKLTP